MEFLNSYCLQGYTPSNICLGLYYNGELLELQSYKNVNIENDNIELLRAATKNGISVIEGYEKVFNY
jgi:aryl-alcohol dehydrogenase-like predicted oxidoreductase